VARSSCRRAIIGFMIRRGLAVIAIALWSCRGPRAPRPGPPPSFDAQIAIARAEARRGEGVDELVRWADATDGAIRTLALRGLARVGDGASIEVLRSRVRHGRDGVIAAEALGLAGAFAPPGKPGAPSLLDGAAAMTSELIDLAGRVDGPDRARVLEAIGRVGDASALPLLVDAIGGADRDAAIAAGIAIGRFGRRAIPIDAAVARAAARSRLDDRDVRYAITYGLARASAPAKGDAADRAIIPVLAARLDDGDPEIRANALLGLTRHEARAAAGDRAVKMLLDPDWRVAVEAVRLLTQDDKATDDLHAVAVMLVRNALEHRSIRRVHVILEGLRALLPYAGNEQVRKTLDSLAFHGDDALTGRHVQALKLAFAVRAGDAAALRALDGVELPDEVVGGLIAEALAARLEADGAGPLLARAVEGPPGRRAAALGVIAKAWAKADPPSRARIVDAIAAALAESRPDLAGSAADAAASILGELAADHSADAAAPRAALERAIVDRIASAAGDPELASSLLAAAATAKLAAARDACTAAHASPNPAVRLAARDCLQALTGKDPGPGVAAPLAMPEGVDPASVIGATVRWTVETTRGRLVIELDGGAAPWHVATFAKLTGRGFYNGLLFHRVVPDFVVQGGDPEGTGWGGPGFTLPAEPSFGRYDRAAVGVADAGKDTGGSQWFAMHARAPHLEGRYTLIGRVVEGEEHIDQLLVGDRIVKASITIEPATGR